MEITREAYRKAFVEAMDEEINELRAKGVDGIKSLLIVNVSTGITRRMEEKLFGAEAAEASDGKE